MIHKQVYIISIRGGGDFRTPHAHTYDKTKSRYSAFYDVRTNTVVQKYYQHTVRLLCVSYRVSRCSIRKNGLLYRFRNIMLYRYNNDIRNSMYIVLSLIVFSLMYYVNFAHARSIF